MARRGENIYKRNDNRWEGRYIKGRREDGSAVYASVYGKTYQEVKQKLAACKAKLTERATECSLTIKFLCMLWLESMQSTVKESTFVRYTLLVNKHIIPVLGGLRADELTANVLTRFMTGKLTNGRLDGRGGLSPKTVQDIMIVVKAIVKMAHLHYGAPDYTEGVKMPRVSPTPVKTLPDEDVRKLTTYANDSQECGDIGLSLSLYTGIRLGEDCALRWSDINWNDLTIHVSRTVLRLPSLDRDSEGKTHLVISAPKTKSSDRVIPLPLELVSALRNCAKGQDPQAYILTGSVDRPMDPRTYQYRFERVLKKLGIPHVNFHTLRHTFATRCVRNGMDAKCLSEILGHATVGMTLNRYVHPTLEMKRAQMADLTFAA